MLVKGRIGIKGVLITCMTAAAMTLILGLATIVISAMMGQANARLESGAYNIRNNPLAQAMLSQEHDRLSLSFLVHDILTLLQSLAVLAYFVFWAIALYQCWKTVQSLRAREPAMLTPGKAVGFLFIPVFGFYWVFPCLLGLGRHLVTLSQCDDHSQVQPDGPMMQGLGIASGVAFILYQFSTVVGGGFVTMLLLIALLLLSFFYVRTAVTAANQLPAA